MRPVHGYVYLCSVLPLNRWLTRQSDGMTARLSLFHATMIMTVLATLFDWQVIYGKCSAETQQQGVLCSKTGDKKIRIWLKKKQAKNIPSKKNNGLVTVATLMPIVSFQCATYTHENDGRDATRNSQWFFLKQWVFYFTQNQKQGRQPKSCCQLEWWLSFATYMI